MQYFEYPLPGFKGLSAIENRDRTQGEEVQNFWVRETSLQVREGCTLQIGTATITSSMESLALLKTKTGGKFFLAAATANLYMATASLASWGAAIKGDMYSARFDAVSFRDKIYLGNGSQSLSYDGATLTDEAANTPVYDCIATWKTRLFCNKLTAPTYGWYSDAGAVTNLNVNYQSVAENDSDAVVGAIPLLNFLFILNRNSGYSFYGNTPAYQKPKISSVGCIARRSIVNINEMAYWLSDAGVYSYGGGTVRPVAFELGDISKMINYSYAQYACGIGYRDYYFLACPKAASTTNDQVLVYDTTKGEWTQLVFPFSINQFVLDGDTLYAAATNGGLYKLFAGATNDAGTAITAVWTSDNLDLNRPGRPKRLKKIALEISDIAAGGTINIYLKQDGGAWSAAYPAAVPTGHPGGTIVVDVQTTKFYNLQIKLETTAKANINKLNFSGKSMRKVK